MSSKEDNAEIGCINGRIAFTAAGRSRPSPDPGTIGAVSCGDRLGFF